MKTQLHNFFRSAMALLLLVSGLASAQFPIYDGMNYTAATNLGGQGGWVNVNTGDEVTIAAGSISYPGIATIGNRATFGGDGTDPQRTFTSVNSGTVYYSFLINVTSLGSLDTGGGYSIGLGQNSTNFVATVWLRSDGAGFDIGISHRTGTPGVWTGGTMPVNTPVFVVVAYTFNAGTTNDIARIWINPAVGGSEPAATLTTATGTADVSSIDRIFLRQDSSSETPSAVDFDEIRVGSTWAQVNPAPAGVIVATPSSLEDFGGVNVASTSDSQSIEVSGSGLGANDLVVTAPSNNFQLSLNEADWFSNIHLTPTAGVVDATEIFVRFAPQTAGVKSGNITVASALATTQNIAVQGEGIALASTDSDIIANAGFSYSSNIDYTLYQGADVTESNSLEAAMFTIRDGGAAADADGLGTELTSVTIGISNPDNLNRVALYDGATEIGEAAAAASIVFPVSLTAADDSTKDFSIRVTYKTSVTDNQQTVYSIAAASANVASSTFATANAGGATSLSSGNINRTEVTASQLTFFTDASSVAVDLAMTPAVVIRAVDSNGNRDLDFSGDISISSTGTLTGDPVVVSTSSGSATFSSLVHTAGGVNLQLTATTAGLTQAQSALFNVTAPIYYNDIAGSSTANPYTTGQIVAPGINVSGIVAGSGITLQSTTGRYNANNWNTETIDLDAYFGFTISPQAGNMIDFRSLFFTGQRSSTGPTAFALRSSVDNYTSNIGSISLSGTSATPFTIDLSAYQDITSDITFRIYAWSTSNSAGSFSINDFQFYGSVEVNSSPSLTGTAIGTQFGYSEGNGPSAALETEVTAVNLDPTTGDITVTAPAGFEVSADGITYDESILLPYTGGELSSVPVSVRLQEGLSANTYNGNIVLSGGGASDFSISVSGLVTLPLQLPYSNTLTSTAEYNQAQADGFVFVTAPLNSSYVNIVNGGYIESPAINFTQYGEITVGFQAATFGGNNGQTLVLEISTDGGMNYTNLDTFQPNNGSTYVSYLTEVDLSSYQSANGKLRVRMTAGTSQTRFRNLAILSITTWDGEAWSAGEPTLTTSAIFAGDYTGTDDLEAYGVTVTSGEVTFEAGSSLTIQNNLAVTGGTVTFRNNANLLQINPVSNQGAIFVEREALIKRLDYVYWSSPVSNQLLGDFSPETLTGRFYRLDEPTNAFAAIDETTTYFVSGRGYMIRAPNTFTTTPEIFTGVFNGVPRNGNFNVSVTHSVAPGAGYNLMGNPYPSPISAQAFLTANPTVGTVYFWTHMNNIGGGVNYASFNGTGAASASGSEEPNGMIQTGQGFLVQVPVETTSIVYNNSMRRNDEAGQFFRNADAPERHRLWMRLASESNQLNQVLVGYVEGATNGMDTGYDGKLVGNGASALYSLQVEEQLAIQGRALPFDLTDTVALGFRAGEAGNYSISLDKVDGLFADGQDIFLKDYLTGTTHDMSEGAYSFASAAGTFNSRFAVVYQNATLGTDIPQQENNKLVVFEQNGQLQLFAGNLQMSSVQVYDVRGSLIWSQNADNASQMTLNGLQAGKQMLIIKVTTSDNKTIIKKAAY